MGFFSDRSKSTDAPNALAQKNLEFLRDSCPSVFEALCGVVDDDGKFTVNPLSLTVKTEGGQLIFSFSSKFSEETFFGTVKDPTHLFDSIEFALCNGQFKAISNRFIQRESPY